MFPTESTGISQTYQTVNATTDDLQSGLVQVVKKLKKEKETSKKKKTETKKRQDLEINTRRYKDKHLDMLAVPNLRNTKQWLMTNSVESRRRQTDQASK
nr:hypothetical protein BaRGS_000481 [Batillaria attramentaria]